MSQAAETLPAEIQSPGSVMTPMSAIERALTTGATPETLERLLALQERYEAGLARKAFSRAMAEAKAKIPVIFKNRFVRYEHKDGKDGTEYRHEDLGQIARTVDPILAEHGLSYRFRTSSAVNEPVSVTCIVSHSDGHSEENTLHAGRDSSGKKNDIQQIGSTITYLQRYTLKAALGLAASYDDDGKAAGEEAEKITTEQVAKILELAEETNASIPKLCTLLKVASIPDLSVEQFNRAVEVLEARRGKK